jgi:DNA helicase-2/ATP-dependent DNA helicase PcrA
MSELNPEQLEAASHGEGPALVLAGPGTGKTTTLVSRYCRLVESGVDPTSILAVTFTRKAAETLTQRIGDRLRVDTKSFPVSTFHAFCERMRHNGDIPATRGWMLVKKGQVFKILRELRLALPEAGDVDDLADAIARFKDRLETPERAQQSAREAPVARRTVELAIANVYQAYQNYLREHRLIDFGDMVMAAVTALGANGELRNRIAGQFRFLMVDEYQDINPAQEKLLELLLLGHSNLWVVGDDDQAIYGWRGSDVEYITGFECRFPGSRVIRLERNYRSHSQILQVADCLIRNNSQRLGKTLRPHLTGKTKVVICHAGDEEFEANWISQSVQRLAHAGVPWQEIAVLVRTTHLTFAIEAAFRSRKVPYVVRPARDFWELPEVKAVLEVVRHLETGSGDLSLTQGYLVGPVSQALEDSRESSFATRLRCAAEAIAKRPPLSASTERKIEWSGSAIQVAEEAARHDGPADFLAYVENHRHERKTEEGDDSVIISTIHQAKGLEWEAVFVAAVEGGVLPHNKAADREEERRLAFVALTRAKRYLSVTHAFQRGGRGTEPSPFLAEMTTQVPEEILDERWWPEVRARESRSVQPKKNAADVRKRSSAKARAMSPASESQPEGRVQVEHAIFGTGVILSYGAGKVRVKFGDGRVRRILTSHLIPVRGRGSGDR